MKPILLSVALLAPTLCFAEKVDVTVANLVRAESDHMIRANMAAFGFGVAELFHLRQPTTTDNQPVIRMNQDTLYSAIVLDLSQPVQITLPEIGDRYQSMLVVSQDHYMLSYAKPGTYELTSDNVGTDFAFVAFRTFVDVTDPEDIAATHAAQDAIQVSGGGSGPFVAPDWDTDQLDMARKAMNDLSSLGFDATRAFGTRDEVDPIDYFVGAIAAWGGLPPNAAIYIIDAVAANDGTTPHSVTLQDVPVDAFWSITVYNAEGYLEANDLGVNSYNNYTAQPDADGAITINFGGCDDGRPNCLPITPGWNFTTRLYEPHDALLDGSWAFPDVLPVN